MNECNHVHDPATGNCKNCNSMFMNVEAKPPEPTDSYLKLFNCYTCNREAPFVIECESYYESEAYINFEKDGECILSVMKAGVAYVILASIDANHQEKIAEIEANEKT